MKYYFSMVFWFTHQYVRDVTCSKVSLEARGKLFTNIIKQDVAFFDKTKSGEILRRLGIVTNEMSHVWMNIENTIDNSFHGCK